MNRNTINRCIVAAAGLSAGSGVAAKAAVVYVTNVAADEPGKGSISAVTSGGETPTTYSEADPTSGNPVTGPTLDIAGVDYLGSSVPEPGSIAIISIGSWLIASTATAARYMGWKMGQRFRFTLGLSRPSFATALAVGAVLTLACTGQAALTLTIAQPGYAQHTEVESGTTSFSGEEGNFGENFIIGTSNELNFSGSEASLQIESLDIRNSSVEGRATLSITLTAGPFYFPDATGSTVSLGSSVGGTLTAANAGDSVTFQSSVISPPVSTGLQLFTVPASPGPTTAFSSVATPVPFVRGSSFDLEEVIEISLAGGGETANISGSTTVSDPEPATASGLVVVGTVFLSRRKRRSRGSLAAK